MVPLCNLDTEVCLPPLVMGIDAQLPTSSLQFKCQFMLVVNHFANLIELFRLKLCRFAYKYIGMVYFDYCLTCLNLLLLL